jgi:hypothetical protein
MLELVIVRVPGDVAVVSRSSKYAKFSDPSWQAGYRIGLSGSEYFMPLGVTDHTLFAEGYALGKRLFEDLKVKRTTETPAPSLNGGHEVLPDPASAGPFISRHLGRSCPGALIDA